jgi:cytochrome c553
MNKHRSTWRHLPLPLLVFLLGGWLAWAQSVNTSQANTKTTSKPAQQATAVTNPGERAFQANCGRCHNPPEQLNTRITGTVLRHMRVRALLSPQDEHDILKYLAP